MTYTKQINRVIDYITARLDTPLPVDELAAVAGMSKFHFHRIFKAQTGETVERFVGRKRMEKAGRELLRESQRPVSEISDILGFGSPAQFCRRFKAHFGMTATEYRSSNRQLYSKNRQSSGTDPKDISVLTRYLCGRKNIQIGDKIMNCTFEIKQTEPKQVVYYRHTGAFDQMGASIGKLMQWAYPRGLVGNPPQFGACYLDDPDITPVEKLQSDVFLVVDREVKVDGPVGKYTIDGGMYAVGRFEIAMNEFADAWHAMCGLIADHGCRSVDGFHHELYLNNPDEHPEKKHLVDIYIPVKPV